jgi:hypothetical protein
LPTRTADEFHGATNPADYWAGQTRIQSQAAAAWVMFSDGRRDAGIAEMRKAADLDDASEKTVSMENKLAPIRALLGELYAATGIHKEALTEFEASQQVVPNRFRTVTGAAAAARAGGSVDAAKRYYRVLTGLVAGGDGTTRKSLKRERTLRKTEG